MKMNTNQPYDGPDEIIIESTDWHKFTPEYLLITDFQSIIKAIPTMSIEEFIDVYLWLKSSVPDGYYWYFENRHKLYECLGLDINEHYLGEAV